jgi:hypothetical protein
MRTTLRRFTVTPTIVVTLLMLFGLLATPQAQAATDIAATYRCPPPPSCTGSGCNPWQCSTFQSGYYVTDAPAHLNAIDGDFVTHCFSGRPANKIPPAFKYAAWIGIGGDNPSKPNGGNLVQTGAAWNGTNYTAFYEFPYFDNGPVYSSAKIPCGTVVQAEIYQNASGQFCTSATWPNGTLAHCFSSSWIPDQTTAEWVDERQICNSFALETTVWSNGYAYSPEKGWHTIAGWPRKAAFMTDLYSPAHILMAPNNPLTTATAFDDVTTNIVSNDPSQYC